MNHSNTEFGQIAKRCREMIAKSCGCGSEFANLAVTFVQGCNCSECSALRCDLSAVKESRTVRTVRSMGWGPPDEMDRSDGWVVKEEAKTGRAVRDEFLSSDLERSDSIEVVFSQSCEF